MWDGWKGAFGWNGGRQRGREGEKERFGTPAPDETRPRKKRTVPYPFRTEAHVGFEVLIPLLAIFSVLLVPILGLTVILTTRFALKPLAETIAAALRDSGFSPSRDSGHQLRDLTDQIQALSDEVHRLRDAQEFDRKLLEARTKGSPPAS